MKTSTIISFAALLTLAAARAQGPLTPPPGAPTPVMKSLDQVEARTPLVAGQFGVSIAPNGTISISQGGSYYLTANLSLTAVGAAGIIINASHVTVDLNGFSLIHTTGTGGDAVSINGSNVTVRNGQIRGGTTLSGSTFTLAGWEDGIAASGMDIPNLVAEDISVSGVRGKGISLSYGGSRIERCSAHTVGSVGLYASSISFSTARKTGSTAISASTDPDSGAVTDCFGETASLSANGISAPDGAISNSRGIAKGGIGVHAETATNCYGTSDSSTGLDVTVANNCRGVSNSGTGIAGTSLMNCHGQSTSGSYGIIANVATSCVGTRSAGVAISATTANGCLATNGTISATNKYNMP